MAWRLQSAPVSAENLVTTGTQVGCGDPDNAPWFQNAAYFTQTSNWIMQVLYRMAHRYCRKAGIGVAELRQASHGNRQARRAANRSRVRVRIQSLSIPTHGAREPDKGSVTTADI